MNTTSKKNQDHEKERNGSIKICLYLGFSGNNAEEKSPYGGAKLKIYRDDNGKYAEEVYFEPNTTEDDGCKEINLEPGTYHLGLPIPPGLSNPNNVPLWMPISGSQNLTILYNSRDEIAGPFTIKECKCETFKFIAPSQQTGFAQYLQTKNPGCTWDNCTDIVRGRAAQIVSVLPKNLGVKMSEFTTGRGNLSQLQEFSQGSLRHSIGILDTQYEGAFKVGRKLQFNDGSYVSLTNDGRVIKDVQNIGGEIKTINTNTRTETSFTPDTAFWTGIRNSSEALSFNTYLRFMDWIFCGGEPPTQGFEANRFPAKEREYGRLINKRFLPFIDSDAYRVVKAATEAFVMVNCGVLKDGLQPFDPGRDNAYLDRRDLPIPQNGLGDVFNNDYLVSVTGNGNVLPYLGGCPRISLSNKPP